jgi:hypothetical protein
VPQLGTDQFDISEVIAIFITILAVREPRTLWLLPKTAEFAAEHNYVVT